MSGLRFVAFQTGGGREWLTLRGSENAGRRLLMLPPLFEEMNRTRAVLAAAQRLLAEAGVASALLDLPGTGESERAIETVHWTDWKAAAGDAASAFAATHVAAFRGSCLIDDAPMLPRWRLSPAEGAALLRDLSRAVPGGERGVGWVIAPALAEPMAAAVAGGPARTLRLASDRTAADARIDAAPPWRRAEPQADPALSGAIAGDLITWLGA